MDTVTEPRVLLDATAIPADRGGVGRYVDSLVAALDVDGARIAVACQPRDGELYTRIAPNATVVPAPEAVATRTARLTWEQVGLSVLARRLGADVVHSPHYTMPLLADAASVVTLHDATFFTDPVLHSGVKTRFFRTWTQLALRQATRCVVPSEATASELSTVAGASVDRLTVIPHGVDGSRFHPPTPAEVRAARDLVRVGSGRYVAFLGALEPRKNVPALIRGFASAVAGQDEPPALVLAGQDGWDDRIAAALDAVPHAVRVIRAGYLPIDVLPGFLGAADVVAYPSLGEGFGLPVLEAMACAGCVLTTRRLALPEVGGSTVAYCGVGSGDVAAAMRQLLTDPQRRAALGAAAQRRATEFSWSAAAARHREVYERAAHG